MASPYVRTNGVGGSSGATLATLAPFLTTSRVFYLSSVTGADTNDGTERDIPFATLSAALAACDTANDILVVLAGHDEVLSAAVSSAVSGLTIIGEGSGASRPTFAPGVSSDVITFSGDGVHIDNLVFEESTVACNGAVIKCSGDNLSVQNCYFECGGNTYYAIYGSGGGSLRITDSTFISVATSPTSQPETAVISGGYSSVVLTSLNNVTVDGGASGWSGPSLLLDGQLECINLDLLNNSDVYIGSSTGYLHVRYASGESEVLWTI